MREDHFNKYWLKCQINDIADKIHYGYTATAKEDGEGAKYLRITDIQNGKVNWDTVPICDIDEGELEKFQLLPNDLVFARTGGTVGKSYLLRNKIPEKAVFASYLIRIKINSHIYPKYIYFFFQSTNYWSQIELGKTGLKTNVNAQILSKLQFNLAPLPEQRAIVAKIEQLFSELDNGIANLKAAREKLEIYRQAVLKKAFEGELTREWRAQQKDLPTADQLLEQIKAERKAYYQQQLREWQQSVIAWDAQGRKGKKPSRISKIKELPCLNDEELELYGELPDSWKWSRFCNVTHKIGDIDHKMPKDFPGGIPYLATGNLGDDGKIDFDSAKTISKEDYSRLALKIKPERGDIIFPRYGTIGRNILIDIDREFLVSYSCAIIKNIHGTMNEKYVFYLSLSPLIKKEIKRYTVQTTQANIGIASIENFVFPLCSIDEQHQIVQEIETRLSVCDKLTTSINESLEKAEALRQSILKKAFEGKLLSEAELEACRKEPDWEPAEQLLHRIKGKKVPVQGNLFEV